MKNEKLPSEVIQDFITYLEFCKSTYDKAYAEVGAEDRKLQDFIHEIEFSKDKSERNRVATRFRQSRKKRREAKDKAILYEKVAQFYSEQSSKAFLKTLRRIVSEQKTTEKYLNGDREYHKRGGE